LLRSRPGPVILCADDYGIASGVSQGILQLAEAGRISATSAIVTLPRWTEDAKRLAAVRDKIAIGLHLNLTLGSPLGTMPRLAPEGRLPTIGALVMRSLRRDIDVAEIRAETIRQLEAFERHAGFKPDHIDGHQHAHALPLVRSGVLDAVREWYGTLVPLVRDPGDRAFNIASRGGEMAKAFTMAALAYGFTYAAKRRGLKVNTGFSGFSPFDTSRLYDIEIAGAMRMAGGGHIVMCHPGYSDAELAALDPVTERREQELQSIMENRELRQRILHPVREPGQAILDWGWVHGR
jgi:predicted glycoside hydrolase/deacetylase ChbG (UPF0249 family)